MTKYTGYFKDKAENILMPDPKDLYGAIFPIGRGFIDFTNTDYSNYLGFTWERELVGLTPVGYKSGDADFGTIGKTGGEKTHTLAVDEMPSHYHDINYPGGVADIRVRADKISGSLSLTVGGQGGTAYNLPKTQEVGGSESHNNLQPYKVVAYWKRIA